METKFRLFDFNFYNETEAPADGFEENTATPKMKFLIQMFAVDETGKTCSIIVDNFKPFFYVLISDKWNLQIKEEFITHLKKKLGRYHCNEITGCIIVKRKKLYGFDGRKEHKFIRIEFSNMNTFNKTKNFWYSEYADGGSHLLPNGYVFNSTKTRLYEANIPPILRYFHMQDISPSGWVVLLNVKNTKQLNPNKKTTCDFEYTMSYKDIVSISHKETRVPYKICSFDIEASSSHGDFPVPIKSYKKLSTNIVEYFENLTAKMNPELCKNILRRIMLCAFGFYTMKEIDKVYPKKSPKSKADVELMTEQWVNIQIDHLKNRDFKQLTTIETMFELMKSGNGDDEDDEDECGKTHSNHREDKSFTVIDILCDAGFERESKLYEINKSLNHIFPRLEGDKVTFIGSTFMNYGDTETNLNHCIVLNTCSPVPIENSVIESYATEREVLLAWRNMIQRENPDIVIGYNIFGFDYDFMFRRAQENDCVEEFLKLSRNKEEVCGTKDPETGLYKIEESSIHIASGQHDLKFIKMNGRLQIDLYNFFRREETLSSYKLDSVAGHFIGDFVKQLTVIETNTQIKTFNMNGLTLGSFIHFEEIGNSVDYYDSGSKFKVVNINKKEGTFEIDTHINPDTTKKVRWCLAKDDVTPKDIFRMTNGTDDDRSVIAKYCIQDCNLVHYLMNKVDILTGFIEMSKICSVPINFLVMRGQGIKLTSFIAKKCREKRTLMPVMDKGSLEEGYEGAIVLEPKCDLYLDNPVACVDYASLYPSSMISENLSHDSKVWTKEYDLAGNLIGETGEKCDGVFIYDNLPDYKYVDVEYDTYTYVRKTPSSAALKVKCGRKICRFAQFPDGMAIMPSILEELLSARKNTRKLIPQEPDEFMKNVLDKRQIGYKLTANSLYGQCGAKTSTFYEKDVAAATTSTGRLLLTYAKKMIEETYGDTICETKNHGSVLSKAEYIYGDTDSVFFTFNLQTLAGEPIRGKKALEITIELAQEVGHLASSFLKKPHDLEYEKTFMPFCLLSKKRYVGILYEKDVNKCKRKEMGIVLKRRDNAPIVKDVYGGIIDILMIKQNIQEAIDFLKNSLTNLVNENYSMEKLIITKSLRSGYKNPKSIAHKVLADRISIRDTGNKPSSGDRIPFVYINNPNKKALQGDRIETPTFIRENNLKIDYSFYITNQIMKPVQQLFALVLEKIWIMQNKKSQIGKFKQEVEILRGNCSEEKFNEKLNDLKNKKIKILLFDEYLRETNNEKAGNQSLMKFFGKK